MVGFIATGIYIVRNQGACLKEVRFDLKHLNRKKHLLKAARLLVCLFEIAKVFGH